MQAYELLEHELSIWLRKLGWDCGPDRVVVCSSGTAALHLALEALELPPGSKVLVPDYTMVACPRAVTLAGLTPVFVGCDDRLLMNTNSVPGTDWSAVMPVHVYGRKCGEEVYDWARRMKAKVVEDLAEAHGVTPDPETDAACWSFYRNKIIAGHEGGAVAFRNPAHAAVARELRSLGFTAAHDYRHRPRGHNYRMSNVHAEAVSDSLNWFDTNVLRRREVVGWYNDECPNEWKMPPRDANWVYDVRVPGMTREKMAEVVGAIRADSTEARMGFMPMSLQKEYVGCNVFFAEPPTSIDVASYRAASEVFYLPISPGVTTRDSIRRAFGIARRVLGVN